MFSYFSLSPVHELSPTRAEAGGAFPEVGGVLRVPRALPPALAVCPGRDLQDRDQRRGTPGTAISTA